MHQHVLFEQLIDERSKRVIFVSHCLLNENTRYLGGAFRPGCMDELVDSFQQEGLGICQMHCPEQRAQTPPLALLWLARDTALSAALHITAPLPLVHEMAIPQISERSGQGYRGLCTLRLRGSGHRGDRRLTVLWRVERA